MGHEQDRLVFECTLDDLLKDVLADVSVDGTQRVV